MVPWRQTFAVFGFVCWRTTVGRADLAKISISSRIDNGIFLASRMFLAQCSLWRKTQITATKCHWSLDLRHEKKKNAYLSWPNAYHSWPNAYHSWPNAYHSWPNAYHSWPNAYLSWPNAYHSWPNAYHSWPNAYHSWPNAYHSWPDLVNWNQLSEWSLNLPFLFSPQWIRPTNAQLTIHHVRCGQMTRNCFTSKVMCDIMFNYTFGTLGCFPFVILYSRKFSSAINFVKSDRQAVRQKCSFVKRRSFALNDSWPKGLPAGQFVLPKGH